MSEIEKDFKEALDKGKLKEIISGTVVDIMDIAFISLFKSMDEKIKITDKATGNKVKAKHILFNRRGVFKLSMDMLIDVDNYYSILFRKFN